MNNSPVCPPLKTPLNIIQDSCSHDFVYIDSTTIPYSYVVKEAIKEIIEQDEYLRNLGTQANGSDHLRKFRYSLESLSKCDLPQFKEYRRDTKDEICIKCTKIIRNFETNKTRLKRMMAEFVEIDKKRIQRKIEAERLYQIFLDKEKNNE